jgi:RNA polymerase sigma factor (sigma-70 family)
MIDLNTPGDFDKNTTSSDTSEMVFVREVVEATSDLNALRARILQRASEGRYGISERELVFAIRALHARGETKRKLLLAELLLSRCQPAFQRHSYGLRHRPEMRQDVMAAMAEHLLREVLDPNEVFPVQNFFHYLHCVCIDEFNRMLRQEGLGYKRDEDGRPSGRPQHIPRTLIEPIRPVSPDGDGNSTADVADPQDQYEQLHANEECQRILAYLTNPLDRKIMILRAVYNLKWDDIARYCNKTERTVRSHFEHARVHLQQCIAQDRQGFGPAPIHTATASSPVTRKKRS